MSDFFNHLLQRHQGESPRVEPRHRVRFEPEPLAAPVGLIAGPLEEGPGQETPPWARLEQHTEQLAPPLLRCPAPPLMNAGPSTPPARLREPAAARGAGETDAVVPEAAPVRPWADSKAAVTPRVQTTAPAIPVSEASGPRRGAAPDAPLLVARSLPQALVSTEEMPRPGAPADSPPPMAAPEERRSRHRMEGDADEELERRTGSAHPAGPVIQTILPIARPVSEPDTPYDLAPKRPEAPEPPPPSAVGLPGCEGLLVAPAWLDQWQAELEGLRALRRRPDAPEHTIQVTIGRVEVRAEAPPGPPKPKSKPKAPAVMSLDDYLKQRKGRGIL